jgi:hypothetical protein
MLARPVFADTTLRCDVPQSSFKDKENMKQVSPIPQLTEENLATYTLAAQSLGTGLERCC